ncbi:MAG: four helix bundle protein [Armatimonadia bacterium]
MPRFEDLRVFSHAYELTLLVYQKTESFPKREIYALTSQMRRAAMSVGANIAEGQRRRTPRDFANFIAMSEGSLAELQFYIRLARDLGFLDETDHDLLAEKSSVAERMLAGLHTALRAKDDASSTAKQSR